MRFPNIRSLVVVSLFLITAAISTAQQLSLAEQGMLPYRSYEGGDVDSISTINGNLTLHIPLLSYPQRGKLTASFSLYYDNPRLQPNAVCNGFTKHCSIEYYDLDYGQIDPSSLHGGVAGTAMNPRADFSIGVYPVLIGSGCCPNGVQYYKAQMPDGSTHDLGQLASNLSTYRAVDATGFVLTSAGTSSQALTDRSGVIYGVTGSNPSVQDTNGNLITAVSSSATAWLDTMGRSIPSPTNTTSTTDLSHCPTSATSATLWSPPGPTGGTSQFKYCWATYNISFQPPDCSGICQPTSHTTTEMVGLVLPNLTSWAFAYDSFGELTTLTLPTGGTILYTWTYISGSCYAPQYVDPDTGSATFLWPYGRAVTSRTVDAHDGTGPHTWTYAVSLGQTTVTDPNGNDTVHINTALSGCAIYETELDRYSGTGSSRALLQKTVTNYQYDPSGGSVGFGNIVTNVLPTQITTTDVVSGKVSQVTKTYDSGVSLQGGWGGLARYGDVLTQKEYDFGNGAPGSLLRQTITQYMALSGPNATYYLGSNQISLPYTVQVTDGSGNQISLTQYNYDETARASSGLSSSNQWNQFPPPGNNRGNNTSVYRWLNSGTFSCPNGNSGGSGGYIISRKTYFDDGMLNTSADPCGNATTYAYNLTYWGALPTTVTNALGQATNNAYDFNTSLLTSTTDPNNLTTSDSYDSMWRLAQVNHPDGGQDTITHQETTFPFTATVTSKINGTQNNSETNVFDGFGRVTQHQLTSDPQGTVYTDTTYDALGRVSTVSNPYRTGTDATTSTGITTYGYDALSRKITVTYPQTGTGTSVLRTAYCGPSTLVIDPTGKWRRSRVDGLGRLVEVDEPNSPTASVNSNGCPGTGEPIWITSYTNDALGNLTNVVQNGSHQRSFTYDSLSRLLCSSNPENSSASCPAFGGTLPTSGAMTYAYNPDGTVLKKTDSRSITANYTYDALLRTTAVTYSNGDPALSFAYDQANCLGLSACQNIGRRTSMTDGAGSEASAYQVDQPNLRSLHQDRRTNGTITKTTTYYLDLAGNVTQLLYPTGRIVNYTYDSADRPSKAVDSANGITYVSGWQTPPASTNCIASAVCYTPQGAPYAESLRQMSTFSGINVLESYNSRLQPARITASSPTTWGNGLDLSYNFVDPVSGGNAGVVYGIANNLNSARSQTFTYDQLNRILSANTGTTTAGTYCFGYQFSYDAWGNLTSQAGDPNYGACSQSNMAGVTADGANHISGLSYDAAGNTLGDGLYSYTWDGESQLKTAGGVTYSYDGDGRRAAKVGSKYYWYGSGGEILAETDTSGNLQNEYVFFAGKRTAIVPSVGSPLHYVEDMLGSSRFLAKPSVICYDGDFTPFGGERAYTNTCSQNYKFEGKERDTETQNDDFGAREYSWRFGRWLSSDWSSVPEPVPYANLNNPQTLNLYSMVSDDPESFADLDGHCCDVAEAEEALRELVDKGAAEGAKMIEASGREVVAAATRISVGATAFVSLYAASPFVQKVGQSDADERAQIQQASQERAAQNGGTDPQQQEKEPQTSANGAGAMNGGNRGTIYKVPGSGTKSGKPYVGRHKGPNPAKTRRSKDGRDRKQAQVVDTYNSTNTQEGRQKEQNQIDQHGLQNLDNKRNEIRKDQ